MTTLHPHWQSTEEEYIVPVRSKESPRTPITVSRVPAAIVGILLILGIAILSFGGIRSIVGQLMNPTPDVTIHLRHEGPDPSTTHVLVGQVIRWVNDDQIPHVLTSPTLPTEDGTPFSSPAIFSNSDFFYTVPPNAGNGTYDYISETSPDISGQIVIGAINDLSASSSSVAAGPVMTGSSTPPDPLLTAGVIAVNPYVVGTRQPGATTPQNSRITGHTPTRNTESGPTLWIVLLCSLAALIFATRGAFRRV